MIELLRPESQLTQEVTAIAALGVPGTTYDKPHDTRPLTAGGIECAEEVARLMGRIQTPGSVILRAGFGGGYAKGGPQPTRHGQTEAWAYEDVIRTTFADAHDGQAVEDAGWSIFSGEMAWGPFRPEDFSASTLQEACLINRTFVHLGATGLLAVVGAPEQLKRFADGATAMQLAISQHMVGVATAGTGESRWLELMKRHAYRRAILKGEQTPKTVLDREQDFFQASMWGKAAAILRGARYVDAALVSGPQ